MPTVEERTTVRDTGTGPLAGSVGRSIPDLRPSFDAFVAGPRRAAEGQES